MSGQLNMEPRPAIECDREIDSVSQLLLLNSAPRPGIVPVVGWLIEFLYYCKLTHVIGHQRLLLLLSCVKSGVLLNINCESYELKRYKIPR